jgi:hypothetical protein
MMAFSTHWDELMKELDSLPSWQRWPWAYFLLLESRYSRERTKATGS